MLQDFRPFPKCGPAEPGAEGAWFWHSASGRLNEAVLSGADKVRISRLVSDEKRDQLGRNLSQRRELLSHLLAEPAADIAIAHDPEGRPFLPDFPDVSVSFSDSGTANALALVRSGKVGVDVETVRPIGWQAMLPMLSSEVEARDIRSAVEGVSGLAGFFRCWAAKEAILKSAGTGLKGGAPRIHLPRAVVSGQQDQFSLAHDGLTLRVEIFETGELVLSRAMSV